MGIKKGIKMDVRTDKDSDAATVISALLLCLISLILTSGTLLLELHWLHWRNQPLALDFHDSPCGDIAYRWMTILDAVPPEGSDITVVQLRLAPLSFTHWNSSRFLESFNYVMHCWRWNIQISSYLSWGTLLLNISIISHVFVGKTGDPLPIFAPKGLDLSWMLLLYQIIITITCWHQLFQNTSLFNQFTSLLALIAHVPTFFGMCCRSEWQERMYIYKWHEVDQTKHEIFCVHIVCNEIQVKVNLEITTFFFFICVFHPVPTFSDLGLY